MGPEHSYRGTAGNRGYTAYTLNMTSLKWLTDADFSADSQSKSIWWHYLVVIVPDEIKFTRNASMWITGGNQGNGPPSKDSEDIIVSAALATSTGLVTGALFQIPNEHTTFASDPIQKSRTEDAIIAFTWDHFLRDPSNPEWLVRFPMVKASIRALDAMTEFIAQKPELGCQLDYYSVAGASKRGWTTWLVGAVDPARVVAIAPIVLDAINFVEVEHHQWRSYGGWTYALQDYLDMDIMTRLDDPNMNLLQQMEDPYFYKDRLTMPKMIVNAVMDEFQQPDDTHYWWAGMPQPKHFLIAPNAEHSLATGILEVVPAIGAWIQNLIYKEKIPTFDWTISASTGEIVATLDDNSIVHSATMWYSTSCGVNTWDNTTVNRRDWRVAHMDVPCTCGIGAEGYCANLKSVWSKKSLESTTVHGKRVYKASMDAPTDGTFHAFFIDFKFINKHAYPTDYSSGYQYMIRDEERHKLDFTRKFPAFGGFPHDFGRFFEFTTEVSVWPDTFPYPDCHGSTCGGKTV